MTTQTQTSTPQTSALLTNPLAPRVSALSVVGAAGSYEHSAANILTNFPRWDEYSDQENQELVAEFISTCFFLPRIILINKNYQIAKITQVSKAAFQQMLWTLPETTKLHCEVSLRILQEAEFVGVSSRKNLATGITYLVVKLWYGGSSKLEVSGKANSHYKSS